VVDRGRSDLTRAGALAALGLDVAYERGVGSALYEQDTQRRVWDFVGGYGACFFGHNHPSLVRAAMAFLNANGAIHAQASVRQAAVALSARLATRLHEATGRTYEILLANTGSEATELAARHAELIFAQRRDAAATWCRTDVACVSAEWSANARARLRRLVLCDQIRAPAELESYNRDVLQQTPVFVALRRGFHGSTARALDLTWDPHGRFGTRLQLPCVHYLDPQDGDAVRALLQQIARPLLRLAGDGDLEVLQWSPAIAFFLEPLQGEGGIQPIDAATAGAWQQACRDHGVPIIADEIQSGMGRTGSFLVCERIGLTPDYVLLGKSLGGGIAKISAVAVCRSRSAPEFALQYTSTFAEDDLSSVVALRALELLEEDDALARAEERGRRLELALRRVSVAHPSVIADVRGCGLMLGIELRRPDFMRSAALRFLQKYGWLGYAVAGYLLRQCAVRVMPSLADGHVLRLEPDYDAPDEAIDALEAGLRQVCALLECEDAAALLAPALGHATPATPLVGVRPAVCRSASARSHVAFVGHFIDADDVALWDSSLARLPAGARHEFLDRLLPFAEPLVCHRDHVVSRTAAATTLTFIGVPVSSAQCFAALRGTGRHALRDLVQRAVDMAAAEGCSVVGLGGYCSIIARNGKAVRTHGMTVTTGNGFTAGSALLALRDAASAEGVVLRQSRAAIIGAAGNIGSVLAALLAPDVAGLTLLARAGRADDLHAAVRILARLLHEAPDAPIVAALRAHGWPLSAGVDEAKLAMTLREAQTRLGEDAPIVVSTDLSLCSQVDVIISASNESSAILRAEHLSYGTTIIVDLAVPGDVAACVAARRPRAVVLRGGVIRTPANPEWQVPGIPLEPGEMFACMAETALMGLENSGTAGSVGALTPERVRYTLELARRHGFTNVRAGTFTAVGQGLRRLA
jgi:acetylornithine/succinyldiaminopimelate/putrescine aminotransferase/predicted amino acid dehydrogenase